MILLAHAVVGCGDAAGVPSSRGDASTIPSGADPVLEGTWQYLYSGEKFDFPNAAPGLDVRGGVAHFVYTRKAGAPGYVLVDGAGQKTEIPFPSIAKGVARVATRADGASDVLVVDPQSGLVAAFRRAAGATTMTAAPSPDPKMHRSSIAFDVTSHAGGTVLASQTSIGAEIGARVERLGPEGWSEIGYFGGAATLGRIRVASDGTTLAMVTLTGDGQRTVRVLRSGAWTELTGLPVTGAVGILELVVEGPNVYLLEYGESNTSTLWKHDGSGWIAWARSAADECLHGLVIHRGAFYTFYGDPPNRRPITRGIARIDKDKIERVPLLSQSSNPSAVLNIDADSRHDVMNYETHEMVSRDGRLWLAYEEGLTGGSTIRLYVLSER